MKNKKLAAAGVIAIIIFVAGCVASNNRAGGSDGEANSLPYWTEDDGASSFILLHASGHNEDNSIALHQGLKELEKKYEIIEWEAITGSTLDTRSNPTVAYEIRVKR